MQWVAARSVYVHFPLCRVRCSYCAFNVTTSNNPSWRNGFAQNIAASFAQRQPSSAAPLDTLYFGGGTPSLATPGELQAMLEGFPRDGGTETTVELNPTLARNGVSLEELRGLGVTRLSVGLQSLDDGVLKKMLREHSAQTGLAAVEAAVAVFGRERWERNHDASGG
jgi:coproporphyrinogen III oxidase-like Fe-S oxidoreductase